MASANALALTEQGNMPIAQIRKRMTDKRTTCTYHCASCDLHFSSLVAFDAHRPDGGCLSRPKDVKKLKFTARQGICNLTKGAIGRELPGLVWGQPGIRPSDT